MKKSCACGCGRLTNGTYALGHHWKARAVNAAIEPPNPSGLCMCGCGKTTAIARVTIYAKGQLKDHHLRYCRHHGYSKQHQIAPPNPSGLCLCGCGGMTNVSKVTRAAIGIVKGHHVLYIHNHHPQCEAPETGYKVENRGFETPCWVWQRWCVKDGGYGFFTRKRKPVSAHRYFYAKYVGPIGLGLEVHHRCHVTCCVNPDHLRAVTKIENERAKKLTQLSMEKARVIRQLYEWGSTPDAIARVFKISKHSVWAVVKHKTWKEGAA